MDKHELLARTKAFALRSLKLVDHLPRTMSGRAIGNQLVRSATSVGANYPAACRSRSRAEFAAKLGVVAEKLTNLFIGWNWYARPNCSLTQKLGLCSRKRMN